MICFTVLGAPQPQGSARAFYVKSLGRSVITSANKNLKPWRQQVSGCAIEAMADKKKIVERPSAVKVHAHFFFDRPKSQKKALAKTTKPDADKLLRSIFDSLTGIVFEDDSQVVECAATKWYGSPARVEIIVEAEGL